jgi:hypothetical protein
LNWSAYAERGSSGIVLLSSRVLVDRKPRRLRALGRDGDAPHASADLSDVVHR